MAPPIGRRQTDRSTDGSAGGTAGRQTARQPDTNVRTYVFAVSLGRRDKGNQSRAPIGNTERIYANTAVDAL